MVAQVTSNEKARTMTVKHTLRFFSIVVLGAAVACADRPRQEPAPTKPNIVFILADDLGWNQVGFTHPGSYYETPNIDRIAREGMVFQRAYAAASICSPTRASLMTGKYP